VPALRFTHSTDGAAVTGDVPISSFAERIGGERPSQQRLDAILGLAVIAAQRAGANFGSRRILDGATRRPPARGSVPIGGWLGLTSL
jgi:hypothetical protein